MNARIWFAMIMVALLCGCAVKYHPERIVGSTPVHEFWSDRACMNCPVCETGVTVCRKSFTTKSPYQNGEGNIHHPGIVTLHYHECVLDHHKWVVIERKGQKPEVRILEEF